MEIDLIVKNLKEAVTLLMVRDRYLLEHDLNELTIAHRLALYLENYFALYNVDCEYNRNIDAPKSIVDSEINKPDIIIHHRGNNLNNLLCIEVKKIGVTVTADDIIKLQGFTDLGQQYKYKLGVMLEVGVRRRRGNILMDRVGEYKMTFYVDRLVDNNLDFTFP